MKNSSHTIIPLFATLIATILIPGAVFAGGSWVGDAPLIKTLGVTSVSNTKATVSGSYNSVKADYNTEDMPSFYFEYGSYGNFNYATQSEKQMRGNRTVTAELTGLQPGTLYTYRAVLNYSYGQIRGEVKTFTTNYYADQTQSSTLGSSTHANTNTTNTYTYNGTSGSTVIVPNTTTLIPGNGNNGAVSTATKTTTTTSNNSLTASVFGFAFPSVKGKTTSEAPVISGTKDGIVLTITDNTDTVKRGEELSSKVAVENTTGHDVTGVVIQVGLPSGYKFVRASGDSDYNSKSGIITIEMGRVQMHDSESQTIDVKVATGADSESTTYAQATFTDRGNDKTVKAKDTDTISSGGGSVLGASVFGAGFFPQTLLGWFAIIFLIWLVIMLYRHYQKQNAALAAAQAQSGQPRA